VEWRRREAKRVGVGAFLTWIPPSSAPLVGSEAIYHGGRRPACCLAGSGLSLA
jgi:hypothetical protein